MSFPMFIQFIQFIQFMPSVGPSPRHRWSNLACVLREWRPTVAMQRREMESISTHCSQELEGCEVGANTPIMIVIFMELHG